MGVGGLSAKVDRLIEKILSDLPDDDLTGRLKRLQYVIDRLSVDSKDAARLELRTWRTSPLFCKTQ